MKRLSLRSFLSVSLDAALNQTSNHAMVISETLALLSEQLEREIAAATEAATDLDGLFSVGIAAMNTALCDLTHAANVLSPLVNA